MTGHPTCHKRDRGGSPGAYIKRGRSHGLVHAPSDLKPYGVVAIETSAHGLPVIGTNMCGAIVDRIVEGENGFILLRQPLVRRWQHPCAC